MVVTFEDYFVHTGHDFKAKKRGKLNVICPFCRTEGGKLYPASGSNEYPKFFCFNEACSQAGVSMTVVQMHGLLNGMSERDAYLDFAQTFRLGAAPSKPTAHESDAPMPSTRNRALRKLRRQMKMMELANMYLHLPGNNKYRALGETYGTTLKEALVRRCDDSGISKTTLERVLALKFNEVSAPKWDQTCRVVEGMLGIRLKELNQLLRAGRIATAVEKFTEERLKDYADHLERTRGFDDEHA